MKSKKKKTKKKSKATTRKRSKPMQEETQLVRKPEAPIVAQDANEWGAPELSASDVVIPKLFLMQKMSKGVDEKLAKEGEYLDSLSKKSLGASFVAVPFFLQKTQHVHFWEGRERKWAEERPAPAGAKNFEKETVDGVDVERTLVFNFHVLLPGSSLPHIVSFKGTSIRAGKELATQMYFANGSAHLPPWEYSVEVSSSPVDGEKGKYFVSNVKVSKKSTDHEKAEASKWLGLVRSGQVRSQGYEEVFSE